MSIIDSVKNTAFSTAVKTVMDYLEKDPEENIPKLMALVDRFYRRDGMKASAALSGKELKRRGTGIS